MVRPNLISVSDFSQPGLGVADKYDVGRLGLTEFRLLQNLYEVGGSYVKRGGTVLQGSAIASSAPLRGIHHAYATTSALVRRLVKTGTSLYWGDGTPTWTSFGAALTETTFPWFSSYKGHVYSSDGTSAGAQDVTIASTPTITTWTPLTGEIPWISIRFKNRIYFNIVSRPQEWYFTNPGAPTTTQASSYYQFPDDQCGFFPQTAVACQNFIALFCQDFLINLSGVGPLSHSADMMPKGPPCIAWRTAVSMGRLVFYLSNYGPMAWDGSRDPVSLDPRGKINWSNFNLTTDGHCWAVRRGPIYRIYGRAKGDAGPSAAAATGPSNWRVFSVYSLNAVSLQIGGPAAALAGASLPSIFYELDTRTMRWTGPHTGSHLCGAEENYHYTDTQELWVGSAASDGKVFKAEQSVLQDDGAPIRVKARTSCFGLNPMRSYETGRLRVRHNVQKQSGGKAVVRVFFGDSATPRMERTINLSKEGPIGGEEGYPGEETEKRIFEDVFGASPNEEQTEGACPQLEFEECSDQPFELKGFELETTEKS